MSGTHTTNGSAYRLILAFSPLGLAAALVCALAACRPAPAPAEPLRVGMDKWAGYYPLVLADELGYLREAGVNVSLEFPQDTHRMVAEFAGGNYDIIGVSLADVIITTRVNPEIRMILCSDESAGADQILSRGPLTENSQIRGKRIGTTVGGFGEIFVRRFLQKHGLTPADVVIVNTEAARVPALLEAGEIDIGHTWEPYATAARDAGSTLWFSSADTPDLILDGLITHRRLIDSREAELRGMVHAWFRALEWWRAHPDEGNEMLERRLQLRAGDAAPRGIRLLDREENRRAFAAGGGLHRACGEYVEFFLSRGMLGRRPGSADLLHAGFVE